MQDILPKTVLKLIMQKKDLHRVREGKLTFEGVETPINFGIVQEEDGIITIDCYVDESTDYNKFWEISGHGMIAYCETDYGQKIELSGLYPLSTDKGRQMVQMISYGNLLSIGEVHLFESTMGVELQREDLLYYMVLEGLQMEFCEPITHQNSSREAKFVSKKMLWDYTGTGWSANGRMYNLGHTGLVQKVKSGILTKYKGCQQMRR